MIASFADSLINIAHREIKLRDESLLINQSSPSLSIKIKEQMDEELLRGVDMITSQKTPADQPPKQKRGRGKNGRTPATVRMRSSERLRMVIDRQRRSSEPPSDKNETPHNFGDDESD